MPNCAQILEKSWKNQKIDADGSHPTADFPTWVSDQKVKHQTDQEWKLRVPSLNLMVEEAHLLTEHCRSLGQSFLIYTAHIKSLWKTCEMIAVSMVVGSSSHVK